MNKPSNQDQWENFNTENQWSKDFIPITGINNNWWSDQRKDKTIIPHQDTNVWVWSVNNLNEWFSLHELKESIKSALVVLLVAWSMIAWIAYSYKLEVKQKKSNLETYTIFHDDLQNFENQLRLWKQPDNLYMLNFTSKIDEIDKSDINPEQKRALLKQVEDIKLAFPQVFGVK